MENSDVRQMTEATEELNIAVNIKHPRPNFPLPRELRDLIYSFLLRHENVHEEPYHTRTESKRGKFSEAHTRNSSTAHTYDFQTDILRVNRQIHDETYKVLRSNKFILVSYTWPELSFLKHEIGLPIVTENQNHGAGFNVHALRVHVQAAQSYLKAVRPMQTTHESFVVVGDDLPGLCFFLRYMHTFHPTPAQHVVHLGGERVDDVDLVQAADTGTGMRSPALKLQIQDGSGGQLHSQDIQDLLDHFKGITIGAQKVKVSNLPADLSAYGRELERTMGRQIVWLNARLFNFFDVMRALKVQGDDLVRCGKLTTANMRYEAILRAYPRIPLFAIDPSSFSGEAAKLAGMIDCIATVCAVADYAIQIELQTFDFETCNAVIGVMQNATRHYSTVMGSRQSWPDYISHLVRWIAAMHLFFFNSSLDTLQTSTELLDTLNVPFSDGIKKYIDHDIAMIDEYNKDNDLRATYLNSALPLTARLTRPSSLQQFGVPIVPMDEIINFAKPTEIEGLVDKAHYQALLKENPELAATLL